VPCHSVLLRRWSLLSDSSSALVFSICPLSGVLEPLLWLQLSPDFPLSEALYAHPHWINHLRNVFFSYRQACFLVMIISLSHLCCCFFHPRKCLFSETILPTPFESLLSWRAPSFFVLVPGEASYPCRAISIVLRFPLNVVLASGNSKGDVWVPLPPSFSPFMKNWIFPSASTTPFSQPTSIPPEPDTLLPIAQNDLSPTYKRALSPFGVAQFRYAMTAALFP